MSLRTRLLLLFALLAVVPLGALGIYQYARAQRAVEGLIAAQTGLVVDRVAQQIEARWAQQTSDLLFLAANAETARIFAARGEPAALSAALSAATPFFEQAWSQFGSGYDALELRDAAGATLYRFGAGDGSPFAPRPGTGALVAEEPILDAHGKRVGVVVARLRSPSLVSPQLYESGFGESGETLVVDRTTRRVLLHPRRVLMNQLVTDALRVPAAGNASAAEPRGMVRYGASDTLRVGSYRLLDAPALAIYSTSAVSEFSGPFAQLRREMLLVVLLVTLGVSAAFALAIRRATRSLEALTRAADEIGRGNFAPRLPAAGHDEVGRLTAAFDTMASKVGEMIVQVEQSRQMAAIGHFAAEISHEIRNPLTSVKLNLQRIDRLLRGKQRVPEAAGPLDLSLREVEHLDRVVRGILHFGRPHATERQIMPARDVIESALAVARPQAERHSVELIVNLPDPELRVRADAEPLRGALLNVLLNAIDAMADGGTLRLEAMTSATAPDRLHIRIADTGPGVPPDARGRIFDPFYSTKSDGTGLGLSITARVLEEHGGGIALEEAANSAGAVFVIELPVVRTLVPHG